MALPIDLWLIVFDYADDNTLWSVVRNVSHHLRACVHEYFRHDVLRECVIDLVYSNIHDHSGPTYTYLHVPMIFSRLSEDGTRAVFRQSRLKQGHSKNRTGSVRGWVPFIERYCDETNKMRPRVTSKSASTEGPLLWELDYAQRIYKHSTSGQVHYLKELRNHLSIGRGDRPPHFVKLGPYLHDTELVDLAIDCSAREVSLDWGRTFSAFFLERHFMVCAENTSSKCRTYDKALDSALDTVRTIFHTLGPNNGCVDHWQRARRKRLQEWVKRNKKRISRENRLLTEWSVVSMTRSDRLKRFVRADLVEIRDSDVDAEETVPEKCADDNQDLLMWPANRQAIKEAERSMAQKRCRGCVIM